MEARPRAYEVRRQCPSRLPVDQPRNGPAAQRQEHHRSGGVGDPPSTDGAQWRPFQIAFILVNLSGLADAEHSDREIADLLWFPTGGGKTGNTGSSAGACTVFFGDCAGPRAAGVSVLMRYTLRLLTLQQYQRATGLICALEIERRSTFRTRRRSPSGSGSTGPLHAGQRDLLARTSAGAADPTPDSGDKRQRPRPG